MNVELGSTVQIKTPAGILSGKVVGTENRDPSRHGNGQARPYVCVCLADSNTAWLWVPASEVTA